MNISDKTFLTTITLLVIIAILSTAYFFLFRKDYIISVEAWCDPAQNICFTRDCFGGECPANELELYRIFSVHADEFAQCSDDACLQECDSGIISCTEVVCGESEDDECTAPPGSGSQ